MLLWIQVLLLDLVLLVPDRLAIVRSFGVIRSELGSIVLLGRCHNWRVPPSILSVGHLTLRCAHDASLVDH